MPFEQISPNGGTIITGERSIALSRLFALKGALGLELKGIRMSRHISAYAIVKKEFGLKGNKQKVLTAFTELVTQKEQEYKADREKDPTI